MADDLDAHDVAEALLAGISPLVRRLRQLPSEGGLSRPERSALGRLERGGPATSAELAREEQIRPQSMGSTLSSLQEKGLIERQADPDDGRRVLMSITAAGRKVLRVKRDARAQQLADTLATEFSLTDLRRLMLAAPLLERLGHSI